MAVPMSSSPISTNTLAAYVSYIAPDDRPSRSQGVVAILNSALQQLGVLSLPVIAALLVARQVKRHRASQPQKQPAQQQASSSSKAAPAAAASHAKPRRDYKVKRDRADVAAEAVEARARELEDQRRRAAQAEGLGYAEAQQGEMEEETEAGHPGAGGDQAQFFNMLQKMGFKVVAPKDGSNQVFLVPPGEGGDGEGAAAADEDEDPDGEDEEGEEEEDDEN